MTRVNEFLQDSVGERTMLPGDIERLLAFTQREMYLKCLDAKSVDETSEALGDTTVEELLEQADEIIPESTQTRKIILKVLVSNVRERLLRHSA